MKLDEELAECVRILGKDPLDMRDLSSEALEQEYSERLAALLEANHCEPTLDGWRDLAIRLAIKHENAFQVKTCADKLPGSGRPTNQPAKWLAKSAVFSALRKLSLKNSHHTFPSKKPGIIAAAQAVFDECSKNDRAARRNASKTTNDADGFLSVRSAKSLQNLVAGEVAFPQEWRRQDFVLEAERIALKAALRLGAKS